MWKLSIKPQGEWMSVTIVLLITVVLVLNLSRALVNASDNYQVLVAERETLAKLQAEHDGLDRELAYYTSYEYKQLYARDNLHLAQPGEQLYKVVTEQPTFLLPEEQVDLFGEGPYTDWWLKLL